MSTVKDQERKLHFVQVSGGKSHNLNDAEERRNVRAFVMKDYLRQKKDPDWRFAPAKVSDNMTSHIGRFRSKTKSAKKKKSNNDSKQVDLESEISNLTTTSTTNSQFDSSMTLNFPPTSLHDLDMVDPFQTLPINLSENETLDLMEYYHQSFYANSYACNPEGQWISVAMADPAILHSTMCLVALHRRDSTTGSLTDVYFKHRGEAMRIVSRRLAKTGEAVSDSTIGAIAILSSADNLSTWNSKVQDSHIKGLATLVKLRGGIDSLETNRHVKRVVGWADLLHAVSHDTLPLLGRSKCTTEPTSDELLEAIGNPDSSFASSTILDELPRAVGEICRELRVLSIAKTILLTDRTVELCTIFSTLLWKTEHDIIDLDINPYSDVSMDDYQRAFWQGSMFMATKVACLIYSYSVLRDLASPTLYRKLIKKLRSHLSVVLSGLAHYFEQSFATMQESEYSFPFLTLLETELSILLWNMYCGWKGSWRDKDDQKWFAQQIAGLCSSNGLFSQLAVLERLQSVVWIEKSDFGNVDEFWVDVELYL